MNYSILQVKNLNKSFIQDSKSIEILNNINFAFTQNISYSIVGQSGTGKSTLLNLLAGIDKPSSGDILFNNHHLNNFSLQQHSDYLINSIGIVFQNSFLIKEFTVLENIMMKKLIKSFDYKEAEHDAMILLKKMNLENKARSSIATLSAGQKQRISVLRAIFNRPKFLLADEPTANLDEKSKYELMELLINFKNDFNMGLIVTTHDKNVSELFQKKLQIKDCSLKELN